MNRVAQTWNFVVGGTHEVGYILADAVDAGFRKSHRTFFDDENSLGLRTHCWMNRSTGKMRDFPQWVVAHEVNKSSGTKSPAAFGGVAEKLRQPLATLTGTAGFRSLLSRALALAGDQVQWFRAVHVKADGSLECPPELAQLDKKEIAKAEVVLITELFRLLVTFIGEALTLRVLLEVWPEMPINEFDFSRKDLQREET